MNTFGWCAAGVVLFLVHWESPYKNRGINGGGERRQPHLRIANARFDVGDVDVGSDLHHAFSIANEGNGGLAIAGIAPTPECTAKATPTRIAPGEGGLLDVTCRAGVVGPFHAHLHVRSNDPDAQDAALELIANVRAALALDPSIALLHVPFGETVTKDVRLVGALAASANPVFSAPSDDAIAAQWVPSASPSAIRLTAHGARLGFYSGAIVVTTGLPSPSSITLPYSLQVESTLTVFPQTIYLDPLTPARSSLLVEVASSQAGFAVKSVAIKDGPFVATIEKSGASWMLRVSIGDHKAADTGTHTTGTLVISSNDRAEPEKEVPIEIASRAAGAPSASK
jgi:hypothetical protein